MLNVNSKNLTELGTMSFLEFWGVNSIVSIESSVKAMPLDRSWMYKTKILFPWIESQRAPVIILMLETE